MALAYATTVHKSQGSEYPAVVIPLRGADRRAEDVRTRLQRLEALWDTQHEQVWTKTAYSYRDFVLRASGPALRLAIYQHLALS